ncbi:MAG: hypothetical protein ACOY5Y_09500 [Pseudomonadota bacterium]|jgi:hypothetical protein
MISSTRNLRTLRASVAGLALAFAATYAPTALAQTRGGSSGEIAGERVRAGSWGEGYHDPSGAAVAGGAEAWADDGTAETRARARTNGKRAMQHSTARARTDDERARSTTRTMVRPNGVVRSTTTNTYKERGEKPVRDRVVTVTRPDRP